jgi:hypothetical protein
MAKEHGLGCALRLVRLGSFIFSGSYRSPLCCAGFWFHIGLAIKQARVPAGRARVTCVDSNLLGAAISSECTSTLFLFIWMRPLASCKFNFMSSALL